MHRRKRYVEGVDSGHPVAEALRELCPPDSEMNPEARERMMDRLFFVQRSIPPEKEKRGAFRWRYAIVPAAALALTAVLILVVLFSAGQKSVPWKLFASITERDGYVEVLKPEGSWRRAGEGERLEVGSRVRSGPRSYASVVFPEGSVMRLTDGSEARIKSLGSRSVAVEHVKGSTYHRVQKGTEYTVANADVSFRALGTAFNVENRVPKQLEIVTIENAVEVEVGSHEPIKVSQGEVMVVAMAGEKKAEKQPVSRERLEEERLYASAKKDAEAGNPTGIYKELDVTMDQKPPKEQEAQYPQSKLVISLGAVASETGVSLNWGVSGEGEYDALALLRSETSAPTLPADEISRYSDISMTSATDNSLLQEHTYQYRLAALDGPASVAYSNTVVVTVPKPRPKPGSASMNLIARVGANGVLLEWSVTGASRFDGFVVERVVEKAPPRSATPTGSSSVKRIASSDVLYSYADSSVAAGHTYSYRVGLVVDGSVMVYSKTAAVEVPAK
ncbi:MAG: FecR domain-containing protein [Actinobacteria bacterium]|nr:FecR domain-containing protein [Actinomycetota bacterium]